MSTVEPTIELGAVLYCGDPGFYGEHHEQLCSLNVRSVSDSELLQEGRQFFHGVAAIVLAMPWSGSGEKSKSKRFSISELSEGAEEVLELLTKLHDFRPRPPVVLLTQNGTPLEICCQAVQLGVASFVDVDSTGWVDRLSGTLKQMRSIGPARVMPTQVRNPQELLDAVGIRAVSPAMQELIVRAYRAAQVSDATVLIHGESGTGKQLLAEAIHRLDPKRGRFTFVPVNCAAITGSLAESELFGHTRGAFTGATEARAGYFKSAHRGTILLDEISELPISLQPKLLRVIQEGRVLSVGSDKEESIDVRVIAASNVSLQEMVVKGAFRLDLYQRLNVIHLTVPPLRERAEDIPLLVMHFIKKYEHYCGHPIVEVDARVYELLKKRLGNGNVRELENVIRQTLVFKSHGDRIELADLPQYMFEGKPASMPAEVLPTALADHLVMLIRDKRLSLKQAIAMFEKTLITRAAHQSPQMSKVQLAKSLGLPRRTLYYKLEAEEGTA